MNLAGAVPWLLDPSISCPCGTKHSFKDCCRPVLARFNSGHDLPTAAYGRLNKGEFAEAEALYRAHFVQYLTWFYQHTLPFISDKSALVEKLLKIDTEALIELADSVSHCMWGAQRGEEIVPFLNHVQMVVPISEFWKHLSYLRAVWLYIGLNDEAAARAELDRIGDILAYRRREALELYLDVFGGDLPVLKVIPITELILAQSEANDENKLQYTAIRSMALVQVGESDRATIELSSVLEAIAAPDQVTPDNLRLLHYLGKGWALLGALKNDKAALQKAESLFLEVPQSMLKPLGIAALMLDLAWVYRDQGKYAEAVRSLKRAQQIDDSTMVKIHLAHALSLNSEVDGARDLLRQLEGEPIAENLKLEFFAAKSSLAISANDLHLASEAVAGLRATQCKAPFWTAQRDRLIIELLDFIQTPSSTKAVDRQHRIGKILLFISESLELKPNVMGMGVNLNSLLEKLAHRLNNS